MQHMKSPLMRPLWSGHLSSSTHPRARAHAHAPTHSLTHRPSLGAVALAVDRVTRALVLTLTRRAALRPVGPRRARLVAPATLDSFHSFKFGTPFFLSFAFYSAWGGDGAGERGSDNARAVVALVYFCGRGRHCFNAARPIPPGDSVPTFHRASRST